MSKPDTLSVLELRDILQEFDGEPLSQIKTIVSHVLADFAAKHSLGPRTRLLILGQIVMITRNHVGQLFDDEFVTRTTK